MVTTSEQMKRVGGGTSGSGIALMMIGLFFTYQPSYGSTWSYDSYRTLGNVLLIIGISMVLVGAVVYAAGALWRKPTN